MKLKIDQKVKIHDGGRKAAASENYSIKLKLDGAEIAEIREALRLGHDEREGRGQEVAGSEKLMALFDEKFPHGFSNKYYQSL